MATFAYKRTPKPVVEESAPPAEKPRRGKPPAPTPAKSTALTLEEVRRRMLDKMEGSLLNADDAATLHFTPATAAQIHKLGLPPSAGFIIPYFNMDGELSTFYRVRYMEDTRKGFDLVTGKKAMRYIQPPDSVTEAYLCPLINWREVAEDPEQPIMITEGELKAACACKHGLPTVGLGGVWSFQSGRHNTPMLPVFQELELSGRTVYIVFDSDAVTNPNVVAAELRLAWRLTELGANVYIARLPAVDDLVKVGLDDYLYFKGYDVFQAEVLGTAFEYAAAKQLHALNERVLYVRNPGFIWDHELRMRMSAGAFKEHAFSNVLYDEQRVTKTGVTTVRVPAAPAWLQWENRASVNGIVFEPGGERITESGMLNTWEGWGINAPVKGDVSPWYALMDHIFGNDTAARTYFERWCAYPLQHPGAKMAVACAIWGVTHGSGKTLIGHTLMRLYGKHAAELKDTDLDDDRNEWAEAKQFVLADDITARGDRKFMRRLMTMITQQYIRLNPKYVPSYQLRDTINYYFTSNDPDALYMDDGDRRFFIHEVVSGKYTKYREYVEWRESEAGMAALWHYLLELDLGDFDPQAPAPVTAGKESMIQLGKSDLGAWVRELRDNGASMLRKAGMKGDLFSAKELHALFDPNGDKRTTVNALARELKRAGFRAPANGNSLHMPDGSNVMVYAVLNPATWRGATWSDACKHYIGVRPPKTWDVDKKGKY